MEENGSEVEGVQEKSLERRRSRLSLDVLLEHVGPMEEVDWGEPQGQEEW